MKFRVVTIAYIFSLLALFLYSFTQVDLSLTLTRASFVADIQRGFQYIGYFNRPLSASLYIILLLLLFSSYWFLLKHIVDGKLKISVVRKLVLITAGLLVFSYTAFSYDIFNYIFDAKIVTYYQENPYQHKALDYPTDPMLSFMRWTHRVYPYGPVWLGVTVPLSFLGMHFFLPTYFLFKLLAAGAYIGSAYFLGKIVRLVKPQYETLTVAFFAFNPLVMIEYLVTGHNDSVMLFLMMLSLYFLVQNKKSFSLMLWLLSVGIKFATAVLLPLYIYVLGFKKEKAGFDNVWMGGLVLMACAIILASIRTTFQPWYLLYILPFASLLVQKRYIGLPVAILSLFSLWNYIPFLHSGNWDPPIPQQLLFLNITGVVVALVAGVVLFYRKTKTT